MSLLRSVKSVKSVIFYLVSLRAPALSQWFGNEWKKNKGKMEGDRISLTPLTSLIGVVVATVTGERCEGVTANRIETINGGGEVMVAFKAGRGFCKACEVYQRVVQ